MSEAQVIQKLISGKKRSNDNIICIFSKLMMEEKVNAALKILDEDIHNSVLEPNEKVISKLKSLHPEPAKVQLDALIQGPLMPVNHAHYNGIDEHLIFKAANATKGSGGPSQMDALQWR